MNEPSYGLEKQLFTDSVLFTSRLFPHIRFLLIYCEHFCPGKKSYKCMMSLRRSSNPTEHLCLLNNSIRTENDETISIFDQRRAGSVQLNTRKTMETENTHLFRTV